MVDEIWANYYKIPKPGLVVVMVVVVVVVMVVVVVAVVVVAVGDLPYFSPAFGGIPSASLGRKKNAQINEG